jgi:hypothetical protein
VFSYFEDDDIHNVYATIHLCKKSFWTRLKYGIKYIFGYQCKYGAFDEFIFNPADAYMLKRVYDFLIGAYREKMNMDIDKLIEDSKRIFNTPHCGLDTMAWEAATRKGTSAVINAINENVVEQTAKTQEQ